MKSYLFLISLILLLIVVSVKIHIHVNSNAVQIEQYNDTESLTKNNNIMKISIFGIGRSDAILITTQNHSVMIDTGENRHGPYIVNYLLSQNITSLDYLIITHFDSDHVGGAHTILDYIDVRQVIVPNYSRESRHVERFEAALINAQLNPYVLTQTIRFELDDVKFMINPSQLEYFNVSSDGYVVNMEGENILPTGDDFSIVVSLTHGTNNFLFTGDAVANRLQELLQNSEIMSKDYDFLKVPRHGRHNQRSLEFISEISPRYAVITGFSPAHIYYYYPQRPADERVVNALEDVGAVVYYTMSMGVLIKSDGNKIIVEYNDFFAKINYQN